MLNSESKDKIIARGIGIIGSLFLIIWGYTYNTTSNAIKDTQQSITELQKVNYDTNTILTRLTVILEGNIKDREDFKENIRELKKTLNENREECERFRNENIRTIEKQIRKNSREILLMKKGL